MHFLLFLAKNVLKFLISRHFFPKISVEKHLAAPATMKEYFWQQFRNEKSFFFKFYFRNRSLIVRPAWRIPRNCKSDLFSRQKFWRLPLHWSRAKASSSSNANDDNDLTAEMLSGRAFEPHTRACAWKLQSRHQKECIFFSRGNNSWWKQATARATRTRAGTAEPMFVRSMALSLLFWQSSEIDKELIDFLRNS